MLRIASRDEVLALIQKLRLPPEKPASLDNARDQGERFEGRASERLVAPRYTVPTGVAGEPTAPGRRKGGAVSKKRLRFFARR
jgi:hypothetical protein